MMDRRQGEGNVDEHRLLLTAEEAARMLSIGRSAIFRLMREGELRGVRIGASRRFPREEIEAYVQRLRAEQAGDSDC